MHVIIFFATNMHQNEWFQVLFFKNFLGRGSPSPLPRPLPPFFLGFRPRFGLRPQVSGASRLCAYDSGFALDSRELRALSSGFALNFQLENMVWPLQNRFLNPPLICIAPIYAKMYQKRQCPGLRSSPR